MRTIYAIIGSLILLTGLGFAVEYGLEKQEVIDCNTLSAQAEEYRASGVFYITENEQAMCEAHSIKIDAPVR